MQTFFAFLSLFLDLEPVFSWFELMHCNKVVAWTNYISMSRMPVLGVLASPSCSSGRVLSWQDQNTASLVLSRCCSHSDLAAPEMLIHVSVMLLTRPTGCKSSGEPAWLDCPCSSFPCQPHTFVRALLRYHPGNILKCLAHLKCRYCL